MEKGIWICTKQYFSLHFSMWPTRKKHFKVCEKLNREKRSSLVYMSSKISLFAWFAVHGGVKHNILNSAGIVYCSIVYLASQLPWQCYPIMYISIHVIVVSLISILTNFIVFFFPLFKFSTPDILSFSSFLSSY